MLPISRETSGESTPIPTRLFEESTFSVLCAGEVLESIVTSPVTVKFAKAPISFDVIALLAIFFFGC